MVTWSLVPFQKPHQTMGTHKYLNNDDFFRYSSAGAINRFQQACEDRVTDNALLIIVGRSTGAWEASSTQDQVNQTSCHLRRRRL